MNHAGKENFSLNVFTELALLQRAGLAALLHKNKCGGETVWLSCPFSLSLLPLFLLLLLPFSCS